MVRQDAPPVGSGGSGQLPDGVAVDETTTPQPARRGLYCLACTVLASGALLILATCGFERTAFAGQALAGSTARLIGLERHDRRQLRETTRSWRAGGSASAAYSHFYVPCSLRLDAGPKQQEAMQHAEFFDYYRDVVESEATRYQLRQLAWTGADNDAIHAWDTVKERGVTIIKMSAVDLPNGSRLGARSLRELQTLRTLQGSEFLPRVRTVLQPAPNITITSVFLVTDQLGTSLKKATDMVHYANPNAHRALLFQILRALNALHSVNVYHWDIRPENVLINEDCHITLRGLGLSGRVTPNQQGYLPVEIGTMPARNQWYHPPELLMRGEDGRAATWAHAVDVWSAACLFMHLAVGRPLFAAPSAVEQLIRITNELGLPSPTAEQKYSADAQKLFHLARTEDIFKRQRRKQRGRQLQHLPEDMRSLVNRMLSLDPYRRPSVAKLLLDAAFKDFHAVLSPGEVPMRTPHVSKTHLMVRTAVQTETVPANITARRLHLPEIMQVIEWFRNGE